MRRRTIPRMARLGSTSSRRLASAAAIAGGMTLCVLLPAGSAQAQFISTDRTPREQQVFGNVRPATMVGPFRRGDKATPLYMNADELEYDTRNNRVIARGNVEIYYNNYALTADRVIYDQSANTFTAEGNAKVREPDEPGRPGAIISAERLVTTADFAEAFVQTLSVVGKDDTRIVARRAIRRDGNVTEFEQGKFTPCKSDPGKPPLWCIAAQRVIHDKDKATITYQDAQFEVFGVPILYAPYFQHADPSVKTKSGFLLPGYSSYSRLGMSVEVPYHFALDPSYDFLFHPMYMAKQGILWQGEWRQRLKVGEVSGSYNIKLAGIEQNNDQSINAALHERWRGSMQTRGAFSLASWWSFGWDITTETDRAFRQFYRLDNVLQKDRVNSVFMSGRSERNYFGVTMYHVGGLILNEADTTPPGAIPLANPSQASPTRVAPAVDYNYIFNRPVVGGELRFNANAVAYWQDLTFTDGRRLDSNANRVTADLNWRRTLTDSLGQTYTPFAQIRGDIISFRDTVDPRTGSAQAEETLVRGVGTAGLLYSYPWVMAAANATHTIEPVGQVIARNGRLDQRRLPDIDCRSMVFSDENLFEDKTAGCFDRIDTGVRANYGLQYTFQANSGGSVRVLAGQSYHISGDNIFRNDLFRNPGVDSDGRLLYSPTTGLERRSSDYVLGLYVSPLSGLRGVAQARLDEQTRDLRRLDALVGFDIGPMFSQVSYAYTAASPALNLLNDQSEVMALLGFRVTDRWSISAQTRYSIDGNRPLQNIASLRYADDCYVLTTNYIETHINDPSRDIRPDRTIMLRMELKYLGEFRYKTNVLDQVFSDNPIGGPR
jgi:LPS-assembly protein